jgi:hypothetical protein
MISQNASLEAKLLAATPSPPATGHQLKKLAQVLSAGLSKTEMSPRLEKILKEHVPFQAKTQQAYTKDDEKYLCRLASYIGASLSDDLSDLNANFDACMI